MSSKESPSLLNSSQQIALSQRLNLRESAIGGIWGPPGTGKTFVAAKEAINALLDLNQRTLICAFQNSTVDNTLRFIVRHFRELGWNEDIISRIIRRTGNIARVGEDIRKYFSRDSFDIAKSKIVGTTLHSSFSPLPRRILQAGSFDRIILDESGQITPEQAWTPLPLLSNEGDVKISAYGDDVQLLPISPDMRNEKSVLRYLRLNRKTNVRMLNTSYRLNSPGIEMTSDIFYNSNLKAPDNVRMRKLNKIETINGKFGKVIDPDNTLVYVGVNGTEKQDGLSYDNYGQAMVIADLCDEFTKCGIHSSKISVMSAYKAHSSSINEVLYGSGIECMTVHRMLGRENDVIIFATTRSNNKRELGFISQPELLNVATSRQLRKLVIIGDSHGTFSDGSRVSRKIYDFIEKRACHVQLK